MGADAERELPPWHYRLFAPRRTKSIRGGRGSSKSHTVAAVLVARAFDRRLRILCGREYQVSIKESVKELLEQKIEWWGLGGFFRSKDTEIVGANGSQFIFAGLHHNIDNLKSLEGVDIVWIEEAQSVSEETYKKLLPTIRKDGSEVWLTWNPENEDDPTYQRFVLNKPDDCADIVVNHKDNEWFPEVLRKQMEQDFARDPNEALWIWEGHLRRVSAAQVLRGRWRVEEFAPDASMDGPYYGLDFGYATTPLALVEVYVKADTLYVHREVVGLEIDNDDMAPLFDKEMPGARKQAIRADCARPETINHLRRAGYSGVLACTKWRGSIEDGVEHLRSYKHIVIHPRCELAREQAKKWSYKVDRLTQQVRPVLEDGDDDVWDAVRYALEMIIRAGKRQKVEEKKPQPPRDYDGRREVRSARVRGI